jgi:hypothetical protein
VCPQEAFRIFLNVPASVDGWNPELTVCSIRFGENPLTGALAASDSVVRGLCGK